MAPNELELYIIRISLECPDFRSIWTFGLDKPYNSLDKNELQMLNNDRKHVVVIETS